MVGWPLKEKPKPPLFSLLSYHFLFWEGLAQVWLFPAGVIPWHCQPFPEKEWFLEKPGPVEKCRGVGSEPFGRHSYVTLEDTGCRQCRTGGQQGCVEKSSRLAGGLGTVVRERGTVAWLPAKTVILLFCLAPRQAWPLSPHTCGCPVFLFSQLKGIQDKETCLPCLGGSTSPFVSSGAGFKRD